MASVCDLQDAANKHVLTVLVLPDSTIFAGGEDGCVSIWKICDGQQQLKSSHRFTDDTLDATDINCACLSSANNSTLYVAQSNIILELDTSDISTVVRRYTVNEDEINALSVSSDGSYLAAADDTGQIKVIDLHNNRLYKTLRKHTNICSSVKFLPNRKRELFTSGYDQNLIQWNFTKNKAFCIVDMQDFHIDNFEGYMLNPPFVHCLDVTTDGKYAACGTENGLIQLFDCSGKCMSHHLTIKGHKRGVSALKFVATPSCSADQRLLVSGGNDGDICVWNALHAVPSTNTAKSTADAASSKTAMDCYKPLLRIRHKEKVDDLCVLPISATQLYIVVSDGTSRCSVYQYQQSD